MRSAGYGDDVKRVVLTVVGVLCLLGGLALIGTGAVVASVFGSDGSLSTSPAHVKGRGVALVVEDIAVDASSIPIPSGIGSLTLSARSSTGRTLFLGGAAAASVDTYLTGAPYDVVVDLSAGSTASTRPVPGTQQPPPPGAQPFWTQQASGSPAELTVKQSSKGTLVLMNADASEGVDADLVVTLTVARAWTAAWVAVGAGAVLVVLAVVLFWRAAVARRRAAAAVPFVPAADAVPSGSTVLPGTDHALPVSATGDGVPVADDLRPDLDVPVAGDLRPDLEVPAAPAAPGLAALVAEATAEGIEPVPVSVPAAPMPAPPPVRTESPADPDAVPDDPAPFADPVSASQPTRPSDGMPGLTGDAASTADTTGTTDTGDALDLAGIGATDDTDEWDATVEIPVVADGSPPVPRAAEAPPGPAPFDGS